MAIWKWNLYECQISHRGSIPKKDLAENYSLQTTQLFYFGILASCDLKKKGSNMTEMVQPFFLVDGEDDV